LHLDNVSSKHGFSFRYELIDAGAMPLFGVTVHKRDGLLKKNAGAVSCGPSRRLRIDYPALDFCWKEIES
jgi:hypothetical protein